MVRYINGLIYNNQLGSAGGIELGKYKRVQGRRMRKGEEGGIESAKQKE